jgi:hypothetical protein
LKTGKFGVLRQLLTNQSFSAPNSNHTQKIIDIMNVFYSHDNDGTTNHDSSIAHSLYMQSMYLPVILHYIQVLGANNVLVVTLDSITAVPSKSIVEANKEKVRFAMKKVFQFMNLTPFEL